LAVKTIVSRVVNALDSAGKQPLGRAPKLTVTQQQIAAVSEPGMDDLDPPPDWRRGPVDPVRTVEEQLAWLREHAA
jgi:hypothetical protein